VVLKSRPSIGSGHRLQAYATLGSNFILPMLALRFALLLSAFSVSTSFAEQIIEGYSVVRGKGFAFEIRAPRRWVLDNEAARNQGLNLVFYPTGTDWEASKAVIYVRVRSNEPTIRNIEDQVNDTLRNLRNTGSPNATAKYVKTLTTLDASKAQIYYFAGDKFGNFEATAYIQAKGSIHFITLSTRDPESFRQALPAFHSVVTSYEDLTKPPTIEPEPRNDSFPRT